MDLERLESHIVLHGGIEEIANVMHDVLLARDTEQALGLESYDIDIRMAFHHESKSCCVVVQHEQSPADSIGLVAIG